MDDPDGLASHTIGIAAEREIGVRERRPGYTPVNLTEWRWYAEGPAKDSRDLETAVKGLPKSDE